MTGRYTNKKGRTFAVTHRIRDEKSENYEEKERRITEELHRILIERQKEEYGNRTVRPEISGEGEFRVHRNSAGILPRHAPSR